MYLTLFQHFYFSLECRNNRASANEIVFNCTLPTRSHSRSFRFRDKSTITSLKSDVSAGGGGRGEEGEDRLKNFDETPVGLETRWWVDDGGEVVAKM